MVQSFTPSELILLHGEKFAARSRTERKTRLLHNGMLVNPVDLAQMAVASALLANEAAGVHRLEIREISTLFGLRKRTGLVSVRVSDKHPWPTDSLEDQLPGAENERGTEVLKLIFEWLRYDHEDPFNEVLDRVKAGLAVRGLLEVEEERRLKVLVGRKYSLPEQTRKLVEAQPVEPLHDLLERCKQERPEIWQALLAQVKKALAERQQMTQAQIFDRL